MLSIGPLDTIEVLPDSVLVYGHFSTIHAGHIRYLRHARLLGKHLYVALIGDKTENLSLPFNQHERAEALSLLGLVDFIIELSSDELYDVVVCIKPASLVLGTEFEGDSSLRPVIDFLKSIHANVYYHAGDVHYASADLLNSSERDLYQSRILQFRSACKRQNITKSMLLRSIASWSQSRLLVVGDAIVDQYIACEPLGLSAEAPVVVVRELDTRNFIGAAAVVAAHIKSLGAECDLVTVTGHDDPALFLHEQLKARSIGDYSIKDLSRPTTFKKRYVVENQKLFRVSTLEDHLLAPNIEDRIISYINELAPAASGIVVSDFVYGLVTPRVLFALTNVSQRYCIPIFGDLQCSTQYGSITRFHNFTLLCPNERELRLALHDKTSGLEHLSKQFLSSNHCQHLIVTMASDGFIVYARSPDGLFHSQTFPALTPNPVDVAGAGDSLLSVMSIGISSSQNIMITAALAACAAALEVGCMGNIPVTVDDLSNFISDLPID